MELFGNNKADERLIERKNLDCMLRRDKVGWGAGGCKHPHPYAHLV